MTDKLNEQISALLDDELPSHEAASVLTRISQDRDLRQKWERYQMIGDVMRGETIHLMAHDISDGVRRMIAQEPAIISIPKKAGATVPWRSSWIKPAAGAALAASVATLAVITAPGFLGLNEPAQPELTATDISTTNVNLAGINVANLTQVTPVQGPVSVAQQTISNTRWKNLKEPSLETRLNGYLVEHSEYVTPGASMGVMPYATFVGYDSKR